MSSEMNFGFEPIQHHSPACVISLSCGDVTAAPDIQMDTGRKDSGN